MSSLLTWMGPLGYNPAGIVPNGAVVRDIYCAHRGSGTCSQIADSWRDSSGRRIPNMLASMGLPAVSEIHVGAFSAGGSVAKRILEHPADRKMVRVLHVADGTYTSSWESPTIGKPPPIEGFVEYALDAIDGPHLLVATASPVPNGRWASGVENLKRLREEVESRSGRQFERMNDFFGITPAPDNAYQLGNVILAEYPYSPLGHKHYKLAPDIWSKIVIPWLQSPSSVGGAGGGEKNILAAAAGAVVGFLLGRSI